MVTKQQDHPEWGRLIESCDMKDGTTMYAYINGNMVYFIINDKVEKSFHTDDVGGILEAFIGENDSETELS